MSVESALAQVEEGLQLKAYDVGDLVLDIKDYPYPSSDFGTSRLQGSGFGGGGGGFGGGGGMGGGGGAFQIGGGMGASQPTSMDDLKHVILSVAEPNTWAENGGTGKLESFGTTLLVAQSPQVQQVVESLLEQLRASSGERKSVSVDARWLLLTSDELEQLVGESGGPIVNREALADFTRRPSSIRGRTSCFSGQLVYLVSGTKRNVVSGYIPVVGSLDDGSDEAQLASLSGGGKVRFAQFQSTDGQAGGRSVGYQPIVTTQNVGALLEIRPSLVRGTDTAIIDLKATVTDSVAENGEAPQPVAPRPPEVDRVAFQSQELATTLRVPLGQAVLVGGMTNAPANTDQGTEAAQLYLVLEVR
jgi:hypothetical protein